MEWVTNPRSISLAPVRHAGTLPSLIYSHWLRLQPSSVAKTVIRTQCRMTRVRGRIWMDFEFELAEAFRAALTDPQQRIQRKREGLFRWFDSKQQAAAIMSDEWYCNTLSLLRFPEWTFLHTISTQRQTTTTRNPKSCLWK